MVSVILAAMVAAGTAAAGRTAPADPPAVPPAFTRPPDPGAEAWGEVRVTADRVPATAFAIAPGGAEIAFFGYSKGYYVYDVAAGRMGLEVPNDGSIKDLAYSPDGKVLATAEWTAGIKLRDPKTGRVLDTLTAASGLGASAVAYLRDGKLAAYCWGAPGGHGSLMREQLAVWDPAGKTRLGWPATERVEAEGGMIRRRFVGPGGHLLSADTRRQDGYVVAQSVTLTDPATNKTTPAGPLSMDDYVLDAGPDGRTLLVFHPNRPPRLVDVATGQTTRMFIGGHRKYVACGAFSPDGKLVATASGSVLQTNVLSGNFPPGDTPTEIVLWDVATGRKVAVARGPTPDHDFTRIAFSPDGKYVAAAGAAEVRPSGGLWKGGRMVLWGKFPPPAAVAVIPDDPRALRAEIEQLRAEIDRLRAASFGRHFLEVGKVYTFARPGADPTPRRAKVLEAPRDGWVRVEDIGVPGATWLNLNAVGSIRPE